LLQRIIPEIEKVLSAGGLCKPETPNYVQPPAIPEKENLADDGHRS